MGEVEKVFEFSRKYEKKLSKAWPLIIGLYFIVSIMVSIMNFLKTTGVTYLESLITPFTWAMYGLGMLAIYFTYLVITRRNWHLAKMHYLFSEVLKIIELKPLPEDLKSKSLILKNIIDEVKEEEKPRNIFIWIIASAISFGFFGLLASYIVHLDFHKHSKRESRIVNILKELKILGYDAETYVVEKKTIAHIALAILSAGLYAPIWLYMFIKDFNKHLEEHRIVDEYLKNILMGL